MTLFKGKKGKKTLFVDEKGIHYKVRTLSINSLKKFRNESTEKYQIWKKPNGYYLAKNVIYVDGKPYAEETKFFDNYFEDAKRECDLLRREYILMRARQEKKVNVVY